MLEEAVNEESENPLLVKIKQQRRRDSVLICISDNGTGISEDKREHISNLTLQPSLPAPVWDLPSASAL